MNWQRNLKGKVLFNELLSAHTTLKIGGSARFWIEPQDINDLKRVLNLARIENLPIFVIGNGSNILVDTQGLDAIVIKLNSKEFKKIHISGNTIEIGAAVLIKDLLNFALNNGLSGCEFLAGIPATIAGAIATNAGIFKDIGFKQKRRYFCIADIIKKVIVMDRQGKIKEIKRNEIQFGYKDTDLEGFIILTATLQLKRKRKDIIRKTIKDFLEIRKTFKDIDYPNAGCIFKNPEGKSAGQLIEASGLKGRRVKGAMVSYRHANFFVNRNKATSENFLELMRLVQREVKQKFNIKLIPEITIWKN